MNYKTLPAFETVSADTRLCMFNLFFDDLHDLYEGLGEVGIRSVHISQHIGKHYQEYSLARVVEVTGYFGKEEYDISLRVSDTIPWDNPLIVILYAATRFVRRIEIMTGKSLGERVMGLPEGKMYLRDDLIEVQKDMTTFYILGYQYDRMLERFEQHKKDREC